MEKTLLQIAEDKGFSPEHVIKLIHHVASKERKTWTHTRNVFNGKTNSKFMMGALLAAMSLPESNLTGRVANISGSKKIIPNARTTQCKCVTCGRIYDRVIFWKGKVPAPIRCTVCNQRFNFKETWEADV